VQTGQSKEPAVAGVMQSVEWAHPRDNASNSQSFAKMWSACVERTRYRNNSGVYRPPKVLTAVLTGWASHTKLGQGCGRGILKSLLFQWCCENDGFRNTSERPRIAQEMSFADVDLHKFNSAKWRVVLREENGSAIDFLGGTSFVLEPLAKSHPVNAASVVVAAAASRPTPPKRRRSVDATVAVESTKSVPSKKPKPSDGKTSADASTGVVAQPMEIDPPQQVPVRPTVQMPARDPAVYLFTAPESRLGTFQMSFGEDPAQDAARLRAVLPFVFAAWNNITLASPAC
jgi:hypothetical protein